MAQRPIEPISHLIRAWVPFGKAQRIEALTYDPLLYLRCTLASPAGRRELDLEPRDDPARISTRFGRVDGLNFGRIRDPEKPTD